MPRPSVPCYPCGTAQLRNVPSGSLLTRRSPHHRHLYGSHVGEPLVSQLRLRAERNMWVERCRSMSRTCTRARGAGWLSLLSLALKTKNWLYFSPKQHLPAGYPVGYARYALCRPPRYHRRLSPSVSCEASHGGLKAEALSR